MSETAASQEGLVTAGYARSLLDYLRTQGCEPRRLYPARWLAEIEAPAPRAQLPLHEWIAMFEIAARALRDPNLAVKAGAAVQSQHLGTVGEVIRNCATFGEALEQTPRHVRLLGQLGRPHLVVRGRLAHLYWTWPYTEPPPPVLAQFAMATRTAYSRWLMNRPDFRPDAHFHFARPRDTRAYARIFGGRLFFDQPQSKLVFPASFLSARIVSAAGGDSRRRALADAQRLLKQLESESELIRRTKLAIRQALAEGRVNLRGVAARMGLRERALQRRLDREGRAYRAILDEVLAAQAREHLGNPDLPLSEIALRLGYSEQSTFQAGFRRWTGVTPGRFRRELVQRGRRSRA